MPVRIQRRRTKGWRMPEGAVYVGRPSRWGNPYRAGELTAPGSDDWTAQDVVDEFRKSVLDLWPTSFTDHIRNDLAGKDLCCWCALDQPCHADILLEIANAAERTHP